MAKDGWRLVDRATGQVVLPDLLIADSFLSRFLGLQLRRPLPAERGLLLVPCRSIHTLFLRFALDVAYLDAEARVVRVRRNLRPWRLTLPVRNCLAVLETTAGHLHLEEGDRIRLEGPSEKKRPRLPFSWFAD